MVKAIVPDLVVGGAPKSGTTSLFMWLSESENILPSSKKETNFLIDSDSWLFNPDSYLEKGVEGYTRYFGEPNGGQLLMEGCAVYLYSETARKFFAHTSTKVIFVLRDPVSRIESNYNYFYKVNQGEEDITFDDYVGSLLSGKNSSSNEQISRALEHGDYASYLQKWFADLGEDRIKVVLLDDLKSDPANVVAEICDWIGIDKGFIRTLEFGVDNASYAARSRLFHLAARTFSILLPEGKIRNKIKNLYIRINGKRNDASLPNTNLIEYYQEKNATLSKLLARDLSFWGVKD